MAKKAKVFLITSQKGGVGKTTNLINLATASVLDGLKSTVIIDADDQRSVLKWKQTAENDEKLNQYEYAFPQVTSPAAGVALGALIEALETNCEEIWIDTAGHFGSYGSAARQNLESILPYVDVVIMPLANSIFDMNSSKETVIVLEEYKNKMKPSCKFFILPTKVKGGVRGYQATLQTFDKKLMEYPEILEKWKYLSDYIPESKILNDSHEGGGNAFLPRKIPNVGDNYIRVLAEIYQFSAIESESGKRKNIEEIISNISPNIKSNRERAKKEKIEDQKGYDDSTDSEQIDE